MKQIPLILFEDPGYRRFGPLTTLRPVWDLVLGLETLGNRIARRFDAQPYSWIPRTELKDLVKETQGARATNLPTRDDVLLVNGRTIGDLPVEGLAPKTPHTLWVDGGDVVAARIPSSVARRWFKLPTQNPTDYSAQMLINLWTQESGAPEVEIHELKHALAWWPWDLLHKQRDFIHDALPRVGDGQLDGEVHHTTILVEETNIHVAAGATIGAGAILDASDGPVVIMEGTKVMPGAIIIGPAVIGANCTIKAGAKLYGPLSIGPVCKLGGEIAESIFIGHSNKQHDGFLGNSIVGEWVNLGADTNNSDLKNNYSNVDVVIQGERISTGSAHFGCIIGDHVKTAINTQINTGTVIGVGSNLFGSGFPPKTIGAFRWGGADGFEIYDLNKFLQTAEVVLGRRDKPLTPAMANQLRRLHSLAMSGAE